MKKILLFISLSFVAVFAVSCAGLDKLINGGTNNTTSSATTTNSTTSPATTTTSGTSTPTPTSSDDSSVVGKVYVVDSMNLNGIDMPDEYRKSYIGAKILFYTDGTIIFETDDFAGVGRSFTYGDYTVTSTGISYAFYGSYTGDSHTQYPTTAIVRNSIDISGNSITMHSKMSDRDGSLKDTEYHAVLDSTKTVPTGISETLFIKTVVNYGFISPTANVTYDYVANVPKGNMEGYFKADNNKFEINYSNRSEFLELKEKQNSYGYTQVQYRMSNNKYEKAEKDFPGFYNAFGEFGWLFDKLKMTDFNYVEDSNKLSLKEAKSISYTNKGLGIIYYRKLDLYFENNKLVKLDIEYGFDGANYGTAVFTAKNIGTTEVTLPVVVDYKTAEPENKTIVFGTTAGNSTLTYLQEAVDSFKSKYPGWDVELKGGIAYPTLFDNTLSSIKTNTNVPNIVYAYQDHIYSYLSEKKVVELTDYRNNTNMVSFHNDKHELVTLNTQIGYTASEFSDFPGSLTHNGISGYAFDKLFSMPFAKATEALFYNKTILDELNIKVPTTWDELWTACATIKAAYPNITPFAIDSEEHLYDYILMDWNFKHNWSNDSGFDTDEGLGLLAKYYELGYFTTQELYGSYCSALFENGGCVFSLAATSGSSWYKSSDFEVGVAQIPGYVSLEDNSLVHIVHEMGPSLCILDSGNDEINLMTWMFMKELLNPEFQAMFSIAIDFAPVRLSAYETKTYKDYIATNGSITAETQEVVKEYARNDSFWLESADSFSSVRSTNISRIMVDLITGKITPKAAYAACTVYWQY